MEYEAELSPRQPMRMFVCKVASRCNIDCDYCYVYHHVDQSWRQQPYRMSLDVAAQLGRRIREHAELHELSSVEVVFHGGEPLVLGTAYLDELCGVIVGAAHGVAIRFGMQTNAVLFDDCTLAFCRRWGMRIGVSLDGGRVANDRHRVTTGGASTFAAVENALTILTRPEARGLWTGFLAVVDLKNDPLETYDYLSSFSPPGIDFLLPLANHERPPVGIDPNGTPYADWLLAVFHKWFAERPQHIRVRRFRDIIALMLGGQHASEEWGLQPVDFVVVESNGDIEAVDTLKTTFPGATKLGLNVGRNSFDDVYACPSVLDRQQRWSTLSEECRSCSVVRVCGGGYFPHRYSELNGFRNPSVYCADLLKLIRGVHASVAAALATHKKDAESPGEVESRRAEHL